VGDKFPKVKQNPWLLQRLGNATTQRKEIIQYRQSHRGSLAGKGKGKDTLAAGDLETNDGADPSTEVQTLATTFEEASVYGGGVPVQRAVERQSVFTSATSLVSDFGEEAMGRSVPDLSDMVLDGVRLGYGIPFECPYCRTIQTAANRIEWKYEPLAHVP
jgi:hypothetical protein